MNFIKDFKLFDTINDVYAFKHDEQMNVRTKKTNVKYIVVRFYDKSVGKENPMVGFYDLPEYFDISFLQKKGATKYLHVVGKVYSGVNGGLVVNITQLKSASGMVFDTANLFDYSEKEAYKILSEDGSTFKVSGTVASKANFQKNHDLLKNGQKLNFKLVNDNLYDSCCVELHDDDNLDSCLHVPAWLTPTIRRLVSEGHILDFSVFDVPGGEKGKENVGLIVKVIGK